MALIPHHTTTAVTTTNTFQLSFISAHIQKLIRSFHSCIRPSNMVTFAPDNH
jgi:hypothetical protein